MQTCSKQIRDNGSISDNTVYTLSTPTLSTPDSTQSPLSSQSSVNSANAATSESTSNSRELPSLVPSHAPMAVKRAVHPVEAPCTMWDTRLISLSILVLKF